MSRHSKTLKSTRKRSRKLEYSKLEDRKMLTGDVRVAVSDGSVFLRGDAENNQVEVVGDFFASEVIVRGIDGTTINGRSEFVVPGRTIPNGLRAHLGQGDDFIRVEAVNLEGVSRIFGGRGDDSVGLLNVTFDDLVIQTFTGDDSVSIDRIIFGGSLRVATLAGNDRVGISSVTAEGDTIINTHDGDDRVAIRNLFSARDEITVLTGDGNDFLGTQSFTSRASFFTGNGDDQVSIFDSSLSGVVSGQAGSDEFAIGGRRQTPDSFLNPGFEGQLETPNGRTSSVFNEQLRDGLRIGTITELLAIDSRLSTASSAISATGFDSLLNDGGSGPDPFTFFAPTDAAFANLPEGLLDSLSTEELRDILRFHIVEGTLNESTIESLDSVTTLFGVSDRVDIELTDDGILLDGDALFVVTNIRAKNGILHIIDGVLLPE